MRKPLPGMTDARTFSPGRRRFMAAAAGTALAAAVEAPAAPLPALLGAGGASNAWIEVDPDVFDHNLGLVRGMLVGGARLCAIMKADAYGTGIDLVMPRIIRAGVPYVGIASNEEAEAARACGFRGKLMRVRAATCEEVEEALPFEVEELAGNLEVALAMAARARKRGRDLPVHLALDARGMSRNGLDMGSPAQREQARTLVQARGLRVVGMMTHFPDETREAVLAMLALFKEQAAWLFANTPLRRSEVILHTANSYATQHVPEAHLDMTRTGGALYGYGGTPKPPFRHVASFKTRVAAVSAYRAGETVSYDRTYTLSRDSLLANLPVGYSDGYRRAYSNKGAVLVRGRRAPVVGNVTMNTTMVDVTDIPGVRRGDEVVLFGAQGDDRITQAEIEELTGVILADQYTVWGAANPKRLRPRIPAPARGPAGRKG